MKEIIQPVDVLLIKRELTQNCFVRKTTNGSNEIYVVDAINQPNTMREIGRLREISFRDAGGGTGEQFDIDEEDLSETGYKQLIVWNPIEEDIIGGYRYVVINPEIEQHFSMKKYFDLKPEFLKDYLPYTMELGRSFIQPKYQSRAGGVKAIYALDNLWDGLGAVVAQNPNLKYLIGKVTMYTKICSELIDMLYTLLIKYFPIDNEIIKPKKELEYIFDKNQYSHYFEGMDYQTAMRTVAKRAKELGENYPPLFAAYANLSQTMKVFGTVVNPDFGDVLETGIMITIKDVNSDKYTRYVESYFADNNSSK